MTSTIESTALAVGTILDRAADIIERDGLHTGDFYPHPDGLPRAPWKPGTPCCALAAITIAQFPQLDEIPLHLVEGFEDDDAVKTFAEYLDVSADAVANWSDLLTANEVVASLREAAAHYDSRRTGTHA